MTLWFALFWSLGSTELGGFSRDYYVSYALWAAFFSRIYTSWLYEQKMVEEIDTGAVNAVLVRPVSFWEFWFAQFFAYKLMTASITLVVWLIFTQFFDSTTLYSRLPLALLLSLWFLVLVHSISFCVASCAFFWNRVHSFTVAKNIALWMLVGEMFPLDLLPSPWREIVISLPFSSGVYIPAGFVTGRLGVDMVFHGFVSTTIGIAVAATLGGILWTRGRRVYTGQGA
jgi:ABC-2 type transport system permease protein